MLLENEFYNITPEDCLKLSFEQSVVLVENLIGKNSFKLAKEFKIKSPLVNEKNSQWLKKTKIIGINPRITKTYWGIVKYAMTFPERGIHLMPLFETGDGSLYVQNSWELNKDFYDKDLEHLGFDTCEKQLKFIVNILHAMNKYVGFDALPHVDNFSEITITNPRYFEWVKLNKEKTAEDETSNRNLNYKEIENLLIEKYNLPSDFFQKDETFRIKTLFPKTENSFTRRMEIRKIIRDNGFEPVPVVEHSPMRPIVFERIKYSSNENWAEFHIPNKKSFAKIIGSLTPYAWYKVDDEGYISKNSKREEIWDYFINHINEFQKKYNFDFLRADMAHNQIAHSHSEEKDLSVEEVWAKVKTKINTEKNYFGTFAEAFFSTYYIDAVYDMTNKGFDAVLGNLNFKYLDENYTDQINQIFKNQGLYHYEACNTIFTNDSDLPEHQELYQSQDANILRYFMAMFMNNVSYMGMGFETRNLFPEKFCNFSNYYVKDQDADFEFGENIELYNNILEMRILYSKYRDFIENSKMQKYNTVSNKIFCWSYKNEQKNLLFIANFDTDIEESLIDGLNFSEIELKYTNSADIIFKSYSENNKILIQNLNIGDCAIYEYKE